MDNADNQRRETKTKKEKLFFSVISLGVPGNNKKVDHTEQKNSPTQNLTRKKGK